ncbi:hypothetical protein HY972_01765 [Candidatus Kaiserbacteria bacterium]|nr:hypothetical protein [Candidatus Kaiserbacteria bacterium]
MKLYIIPGYKETIRDYQWLISKTKDKYNVEFLDLQLKGNSLSQLSKTKIDSNSIVFGFSTGALIAYKLKAPVKKGIYCSMSEILGSDVNHAINHMIKLFGEETTNELRRMRYGKPKAKKFVLFCGDKEMTQRVFKLGKVNIVKNTGHEFTKAYKQAVLKEM